MSTRQGGTAPQDRAAWHGGLTGGRTPREAHDLPGPAAGDARFRVAWSALDAADAVSTAAFASGRYRVWAKPDGSPVTDVDLTVERLVTEAVRVRFPHDTLLGEETAPDQDGETRWVVDPLDGTANFVEGVPLYAHLVAWVVRGAPVFALVSAPVMGRRWWAYRGHGAFLGDRPIAVSRIDRLDQARICLGGVRDYRPHEAQGIFRLARRCRRSRGFGNFLPYALVASGAYDLATVGAGGRLWDVAPMALLLAEAGGRLTTLAGREWAPPAATLVSNTVLHQPALAVIRSAAGRRARPWSATPRRRPRG